MFGSPRKTERSGTSSRNRFYHITLSLKVCISLFSSLRDKLVIHNNYVTILKTNDLDLITVPVCISNIFKILLKEKLVKDTQMFILNTSSGGKLLHSLCSSLRFLRTLFRVGNSFIVSTPVEIRNFMHSLYFSIPFHCIVRYVLTHINIILVLSSLYPL